MERTWLDCLPDEILDMVHHKCIASMLSEVHNELIPSTQPSRLTPAPALNVPVVNKILSYFPDLVYENVESYYLVLDWLVHTRIVSEDRIQRMIESDTAPPPFPHMTDLQALGESAAFLILSQPLCKIDKNFYRHLLERFDYQTLLSFKRFVENRCNM